MKPGEDVPAGPRADPLFTPQRPAAPTRGTTSPATPSGLDLVAAPLEEVLRWLGTTADTGLGAEEIEARRRQYGPNAVAEQRPRQLREFLKKFWGLSAWMLELIMVLSWVLAKYSDLVVVSALLLVNAVVGFVQERRATGVVETLRRRLAVNARVLRDGAWQVIPAGDLIPGDIIRLRAGDFVPADARTLGDELSVDQSALTGESVDVEKRRGDVLYCGAVVRRGEATAVVILTGARTYFGRTTELVQRARPKLHVEAVIARVVGQLFVVVGVLVATAVMLAAVRGLPLLEVLPLALVLLMSAVPVALPVMFSASTALGSLELARKGVLVTRLSASEDAATMDVLCVDKTGTITMNRLAIMDVIPLDGFTRSDVVGCGALASAEANQDPIDLAFLAAAQRSDITPISSTRVLRFTPFDARTRRTEALVDRDGQHLRVLKGAVPVVADECGLDPIARADLDARARLQAAKGYRVLAVARGAEGRRPEPVGLVALADPPRPDASGLIAALRDRSVVVKMLTGDALPVAQEIAHSVGLGTVRPVGDLTAGAAPTDLVESADGFAEVYPEDKFTVVEHLQQAGRVVGMTGDGVNDAPALRQAEVGIAVSNATDVAKGAASVVLTDEGLAGIVTLVDQGRIIYQRILTWVINKISRTILKSGFVTVAFLVTGTFVISASGMLLLVFLTDFAKIALATDRVRPARRPETWRSTGQLRLAVTLGLIMLVEACGLLAIGWSGFGLAQQQEALHTFTFQTLFYFALFSIVSIRERGWFWASRPSGTLLVVLVVDALVGTALSTVGVSGLSAIPWEQTLAVFGYAMVCCLLVNDVVKVILTGRLGLRV
jgi:plasma-membrane proton-efflux P-type ATPase